MKITLLTRRGAELFRGQWCIKYKVTVMFLHRASLESNAMHFRLILFSHKSRSYYVSQFALNTWQSVLFWLNFKNELRETGNRQLSVLWLRHICSWEGKKRKYMSLVSTHICYCRRAIISACSMLLLFFFMHFSCCRCMKWKWNPHKLIQSDSTKCLCIQTWKRGWWSKKIIFTWKTTRKTFV